MNIGRPNDHPFADESGAILGTQSVLDLLRQGWLFQEETWQQERLRPASYDLVIAKDNLRIPNPKDPENPRVFSAGEPLPEGGFELRPGDFAFVTTREKLCLPWTVAGSIGVKNRFARRGLLILTGLVVDPGYGLKRQDGGGWHKDPQPLHFGIANIGRDPVIVVPGIDAIASVQFISVKGPVLLETIYVPKTEDPVAKGFVLFTEFERDLDHLERDIGDTKASVQTVVIFGLYLILATFLGALVAIVLGAVSNEAVSERLTTMFTTIDRYPWQAVLLALALFSVAVSLGAMVLWPVRKLLGSLRRRG